MSWKVCLIMAQKRLRTSGLGLSPMKTSQLLRGMARDESSTSHCQGGPTSVGRPMESSLGTARLSNRYILLAFFGSLLLVVQY